MSEKDEMKKYTSGLGEEFDREFDEAYRLAMEMIVEKRGGDRSIIYQKLMDSAPNIGMVVVEREAVYQGEKGTLVWDYGLCNEITFIYDDDPDHIAVLYTAKDEYDAEQAFNRLYNEMRPEGAPEEEMTLSAGGAEAPKGRRNPPNGRRSRPAGDCRLTVLRQ